MIIHKIQLRGFLSHRGVPDASLKGGYAFTELDFTRSPLWLIHGENGTGKSSIFDAIYFALYKRARGKAKGEQNHGFLIHHNADRAEVRLFLEIGGCKFRIERAIKRGREVGKATPDSAVYQGWEDGAKMVADTKNKAEIWTKNALRMDADTFAYAVLLRQGDTDKFLKADAAERKSCLLQLLDLGEFEKLGKAADEVHSGAKRDVSQAQTRFDGVEVLAPDALEIARQAVEDAEKQVAAAGEAADQAASALTNGRQIAGWQRQIADLETRNTVQKQLLVREAAILHSAKRYRELGRVLPLLRGLWDTKNRLNDEETLLRTACEREKNACLRRNEAKQQADTALQDKEVARKRQRQAHEEFENARIHAGIAHEESQVSAQIEAAESAIATQNARLNPYRSWLDHAKSIEDDFARWNWLQTRLPALEKLYEAIKIAEGATSELKKAQSKAQIAQGDFETAVTRCNKARESLKAVQDQGNDLESQLTELRRRLGELKARSDLRKEVENVDECPYCGSTLCEENTTERLKAEREEWTRQGRELKRQIRQQDENLQDLKTQEHVALEEFNEAEKNSRQAEIHSRTTMNDVGHASKRDSEARQQVKKERTNCDGFVEELDNLINLRDQFLILEGANDERQNLLNAQRIETAVHAACEVHKEKLAALPNWSVSERATKKEAAKTANAMFLACDTELANANRALKMKDEASHELESQFQQSKFELTSLQEQVAQSKMRVEHEQKRVAEAHKELEIYEGWANHPATQNLGELSNLKSEREVLQGAEADEKAFFDAQKNTAIVEAEIKMLQSQIEALPAEHRLPVNELEAENAIAELKLEQAQSEEDVRRENESRLKILARDNQAREQELQTAERDAALAKKLADALGKSGLQATIQQRAQNKLKAEANKVLGRLTKNEWALHLEEKSDNRLEIWADDQRTERHLQFEYISGGERMRIAVALAVAIGQSVTGGTPVQSLIIDEGFGALDGPNRERMVDELKRLSEEEFGGGRVIVISHQDDVCEPFTHRFHIERDNNGGVTATPFPNYLLESK